MSKKGGMDRRGFIMGAGASILSLPFLETLVASAAQWPANPVKTSVGFAAGGGVDTLIRAIAPGMEKALNGRIDTNNMPGASAAMATDFVWNKPADGYWWLGTSGYNKALRVMDFNKTVPYRDWVWFPVGSTLLSWSVKPESPLKTFQDLLDSAKKRGGKVVLSHSGVGDIWHEGDAILAKAAGVDFSYIPYRGGAPATLACLQGEVDCVSSGLHEHIEFIRVGKLRNLAVFTESPVQVDKFTFEPVTKYVPGVKGYAPFGGVPMLALRRDTPVEILKVVRSAHQKGLEDPKFEEILKQKIAFKVNIPLNEADRQAALQESVTAWTFKELGLAKMDPAALGIPKPEEFDKWWPPKDYKSVLP
jgi:tripartite-type tricarboxylate transporter receptor subunit TctC